MRHWTYQNLVSQKFDWKLLNSFEPRILNIGTPNSSNKMLFKCSSCSSKLSTMPKLLTQFLPFITKCQFYHYWVILFWWYVFSFHDSVRIFNKVKLNRILNLSFIWKIKTNEKLYQNDIYMSWDLKSHQIGCLISICAHKNPNPASECCTNEWKRKYKAVRVYVYTAIVYPIIS